LIVGLDFQTIEKRLIGSARNGRRFDFQCVHLSKSSIGDRKMLKNLDHSWQYLIQLQMELKVVLSKNSEIVF
jgi:hypothetical protein